MNGKEQKIRNKNILRPKLAQQLIALMYFTLVNKHTHGHTIGRIF